ncbi:E3 ubiquitin-protein ligase RNF182-like [Sinocyclocheilus rhinocerous]|uniref:E3 ubiquitin-protein ligase RNF182 n=1 Tax=Sinocyclocheilus rhinocerous TaxID=307959 RepID=A0A673HFG1_9TELE|nr:PREDICTED: E3 ubiquitin-protein ligase RNF182-like [Sinocyclocheilus rhinocerous]
MFPETECGICYRIYNLSRRCPRQLCCKHTFCESCLVTLWRSAESPEPRIMCPLCRHSTPLSEARIQETLPVDEDIFERLVTAGYAEECADDDEDTEEPKRDTAIPPKEEVSPPQRSRKRRLMKCFNRLCQKFTGDVRRNCMTDEDFRDLAMMSCYMM